MKDNGLLQYYKSSGLSANGILKLSQMGGTFSRLKPQRIKHNVVKVLSSNGKYFYIKSPQFYKEVDCEVLLGQLYNKAGLRAAVYTPVDFNHKQSKYPSEVQLISNDVAPTGNDVLASKFFDNHKINSNLSTILFPSVLPSKQSVLEQYFDKKARRDLVLMPAMDAACLNTDRSLLNFYVNTRNGKVNGLSVFDNGFCMETIQEVCKFGKYGSDVLDSYFRHNLNMQELSIADFIEELKENETINNVITPTEIAEVVGGVNVKGCAEDIEKTIGYKVDSEVVDVFERSINNFAEELTK